MTALGFAHVVFAGLAIGSAAILLALRKGTTWHRRHGWFYVCNMAGLSITALLLYRLTGRFGPFHLAAIL